MARENSGDQGPGGYDAEPADVAAGGTEQESDAIDRSTRERPGDGGIDVFHSGEKLAGDGSPARRPGPDEPPAEPPIPAESGNRLH